MRYKVLGILSIAVAVSLGAQAPEASAQEKVTTNSSVITVDVLPLGTEVRLNGTLIGTGRQLAALPVFVVPGEHQLDFTAPGHLPATIQVTGTPDWSTRVWMVLVPERR